MINPGDLGAGVGAPAPRTGGAAALRARLDHGVALLGEGRAEEAVVCLAAVLAFAPDHVATRVALGAALRAMGEPLRAIRVLRLALEREPQSAEAAWNLGLALLQAGHWREGWTCYEARQRLAGVRGVEGPAWQGERAGLLLVHAEQGLGDTFQFLPMLRRAAARVERLVFAAPPALVPLLAGVDVGVEIVVLGGPLPAFTHQAPLLSLIHRMGLDADCAPRGPYLRPPPLRAELAGALLGRRPRIGLAWQGRRAYRADRERSIPLAAFEPLLCRGDVEVFSLQHGDGTEQIAALPPMARQGLHTLPLDAGGAFLDTAALLPHLDLVIASDSAVAHLAGALGRPTLLALPFVPDWRWPLQGEACAWYPNHRLVRQTRPGDWAGVVRRILGMLPL